MIYHASDIISSRSRHGEGAVWCPRQEVCLFCDSKDRFLWRLRPASGEISRIMLEFVPKAVLENACGGFLGVSAGAVYLLDENFRIRKLIRDFTFDPVQKSLADAAHGGQSFPAIETERNFVLGPGEEFNDCRIGPDGALYLGTQREKDRNNHLLRLDPDGSVSVLLENVTCSNGFAWSEDLKIFYYTDTLRHTIYAYDFKKNARLSRKRIVFSNPDILPDGLTLDNEGMLWSAIWGEGQVVHIDPRRGTVLDVITTKPLYSSSCTFGGMGSTMLYITTSRKGASAEESSPDGVETAGDVYAVEVPFRGSASLNWQGNFQNQ